MMNRHEYDSSGNLVYRAVADIDAGTVVITEADGSTRTEPIPAGALAQARAEQREQNQLTRLDGNFDDLRANTAMQDAERLVVADYRQNETPADLRAMARLVNDQRATIIDLRAMVLDLTRLVRGIAAED